MTATRARLLLVVVLVAAVGVAYARVPTEDELELRRLKTELAQEVAKLEQDRLHELEVNRPQRQQQRQHEKLRHADIGHDDGAIMSGGGGAPHHRHARQHHAKRNVEHHRHHRHGQATIRDRKAALCSKYQRLLASHQADEAASHVRFLQTHCDVKLVVLQLNLWDSLSHVSNGPQTVARLVDHLQVDVLTVQECTNATLHEIARRLGGKWTASYPRVSSHAETTGIITRLPIARTYTFPDLQARQHHPRYHGIKVEVVPGVFFRVFSVHLYPNPHIGMLLRDGHYHRGASSEERASTTGAVMQIAEQSNNAKSGMHGGWNTMINHDSNDPGLPTIIGGDFNQMSHLDHNDQTAADKAYVAAHGGPVKPLKYPVSTFLASKDYVDTYRTAHPSVTSGRSTAYGFTKCGEGICDRIDYIYTHGGNGHAFTVQSSSIVSQSDLASSNERWISDHKGVVSSVRFS
eukprot:TRINITY_DN66746_c6_g4_i1.p1 TRINITY_DN66746_c6_g4~~TRINITY_DN66746_c6_g4_i1.p1  ORF type:complete len:478 (+),score=213.99 TRINITY_DN66746_c6_g4_i1:51-1436(+)